MRYHKKLVFACRPCWYYYKMWRKTISRWTQTQFSKIFWIVWVWFKYSLDTGPYHLSSLSQIRCWGPILNPNIGSWRRSTWVKSISKWYLIYSLWHFYWQNHAIRQGKRRACLVLQNMGYGIYMYWCTVNRTFHHANLSTLKHFIRQFFSFPIVSYGVWDGESYKKLNICSFLSHI